MTDPAAEQKLLPLKGWRGKNTKAFQNGGGFFDGYDLWVANGGNGGQEIRGFNFHEAYIYTGTMKFKNPAIRKGNPDDICEQDRDVDFEDLRNAMNRGGQPAQEYVSLFNGDRAVINPSNRGHYIGVSAVTELVLKKSDNRDHVTIEMTDVGVAELEDTLSLRHVTATNVGQLIIKNDDPHGTTNRFPYHTPFGERVPELGLSLVMNGVKEFNIQGKKMDDVITIKNMLGKDFFWGAFNGKGGNDKIIMDDVDLGYFMPPKEMAEHCKYVSINTNGRTINFAYRINKHNEFVLIGQKGEQLTFANGVKHLQFKGGVELKFEEGDTPSEALFKEKMGSFASPKREARLVQIQRY